MSTISEPTRRIVAQSNSGCKVAHYFFERSSLKWVAKAKKYACTCRGREQLFSIILIYLER